MSLQHAAKHLEKHGRNGDTMLVHMSPREVKSLNDLAMAHGGHLTINPHTGLAEAGFLSSILPMVAGAGLMAMSGGVINPMTAGLIVGGGTGLMTGDLKKGLMAGLGAYGGAGLGSALAQSGMQAAASASPEVLAAQQNAVSNATALGSSAPNMVPYTPEGFAEAARATTAPIDVARQSALESAQSQFAAPATSFTDRLSTMGQGFKSLGSSGGIGNFYENLGNVEGTFGPKTTLAAAAAPIAMEALTPKPTTPMQTDKDMGQRYTYNAGTVTPAPVADASGREQTYFRPSYTPVSADAARGIYGYAGGGPVEAMSSANAVGANTGYPMADINKPVYASPFQTPVSNNVVHGTSDTGVNPMTGEMLSFAHGGMMASGGITGQGDLQLNIPLDLGDGSRGNSYGGGNNGGGTYPFQSAGGFTGNNNAPQVLQQAQRMQPYQASPTRGLGAPQGNFLPSVEAEPQGLNNSTMSDTFKGTGAFGGNPQQALSQLMGLLGGQKMASGGLSDAHYNLGSYSDGGRLLRGPGDGVSDSIPAVIGKKQPARLADGEFVVPARIVSELGNGSTEAGARKLYAMMDRIQKARGKTVGKGKVAKNSRSEKYLPA
jgi:hypothetical protein